MPRWRSAPASAIRWRSPCRLCRRVVVYLTNSMPSSPTMPASGGVDPRRYRIVAEAAADLPRRTCTIVGITGTNGKSTVTALVTHMLLSAGVPALMGGNIQAADLGRDPLPKTASMCSNCRGYQMFWRTAGVRVSPC